MHTTLPPASITHVDTLPFKMGSRVRRGLYLEECASVHAVIERGARAGEFLLRDLNTTTGTFINDEPIRCAPIHHGDIITIGEHHLEVNKDNDQLWLVTMRPAQQPLPQVIDVVPDAIVSAQMSPLHEQEQLSWESVSSWFQQEVQTDTPTSAPTLDISLVWGQQILWTRTVESRTEITIGQDGHADITIAHPCLDHSPAPLLRYHEALGWMLELPQDIDGSVHTSTLRRTLAQHRARHGDTLIIDPNMGTQRIELSFDDVEIHIHMSPRAPRLHRPLSLDPTPFPYLGVSACVHWAALLLLLSLPQMSAVDVDFEVSDDRIVSFASPPPQQPPLPTPTGKTQTFLGDGQDRAISAQHGGPEGAAGDRSTTTERGRLSIKRKAKIGRQHRVGTRRHSMSNAKASTDTQQDSILKHIKQTGALATLNTASDSKHNDASLGEDASNALGRLKHHRRQTSAGHFGLGVSNVGRGGAGRDERGVGIATLTKIRDGAKLGGAGMHIKSKRHSPHRPDDLHIKQASQPKGEDCLPPQIIKRVVTARQRQLRVCYQSALIHHPTLKGVLTTRLTIDGAQGKVTRVDVDSDTLQSGIVRRCVVKQLKTLAFPKNAKCGVIKAKYPLNFHTPRTSRAHHQDGQEGPGVFK